ECINPDGGGTQGLDRRLEYRDHSVGHQLVRYDGIGRFAVAPGIGNTGILWNVAVEHGRGVGRRPGSALEFDCRRIWRRGDRYGHEQPKDVVGGGGMHVLYYPPG